VVNDREKFLATFLLLIVAAACTSQPPAVQHLSDAIDEAARALISSTETSTSIDFRTSAEPPWFVILIPKSGFDATAAKAAGVDQSLSWRIEERGQFWRKKGHGIVVVSTPTRLELGRLGNFTDLDVTKQLIVRGSSPEVQLRITLSRIDNRARVTDMVMK
jgi:hypothetical protein